MCFLIVVGNFLQNIPAKDFERKNSISSKISFSPRVLRREIQQDVQKDGTRRVIRGDLVGCYHQRPWGLLSTFKKINWWWFNCKRSKRKKMFVDVLLCLLVLSSEVKCVNCWTNWHWPSCGSIFLRDLPWHQHPPTKEHSGHDWGNGKATTRSWPSRRYVRLSITCSHRSRGGKQCWRGTLCSKRRDALGGHQSFKPRWNRSRSSWRRSRPVLLRSLLSDPLLPIHRLLLFWWWMTPSIPSIEMTGWWSSSSLTSVPSMSVWLSVRRGTDGASILHSGNASAIRLPSPSWHSAGSSGVNRFRSTSPGRTSALNNSPGSSHVCPTSRTSALAVQRGLLCTASPLSSVPSLHPLTCSGWAASMTPPSCLYSPLPWTTDPAILMNGLVSQTWKGCACWERTSRMRPCLRSFSLLHSLPTWT